MILGLSSALICLAPVTVDAQVRTRVRISIPSTAEIRIEADSFSPVRSWSFRNAYAGVLGIAERVEAFQAVGVLGEDVAVRKIAVGEYRSDAGVAAISYTVRLPGPLPADVSHVSWLASDHGFLMLADLLPYDFETVSVEFTLPPGWVVYSSIAPDQKRQYQVLQPEKAVFFVGRSLRKVFRKIDGMVLETVIGGTWPFTETGALKAAVRVMEKYLTLTGFRLPTRSVVMIAPLPVSVGSTKWRAETRGSTVVLLMDPQARIGNWIGQLGVIFTHEILHLWVPNSLRMQGDYDWFFEGFTLYTALVTALELKIINFREYLDTLARVYDSYLSHAGNNLSLLEASERRWTGSGSLVYEKGMLVAFLYDLIVRKESGAKLTLADRYRDLFSRPAAEQEDGNEVIIRLLASSPATDDFTKAYIETNRELELERVLPMYGLLLDSSGNSSRLVVGREPKPDQKRLLRSLGYRK